MEAPTGQRADAAAPVRHHGAMLRRALLPAVLAALVPAGCGGSPDDRDEPPRPDRPVTFAELRSPDARSPLMSVRGGGAWRCPTPGRLQLSITADGEATLIGDRPLALVTRSRTLINRACERHGRASAGTRSGTLGGRVGASTLRCRAPAFVLVHLRDGDLTVRAGGDARFLVRAAVRTDQIGVAGYWGAGCAPV
jgi:hypothetical protein